MSRCVFVIIHHLSGGRMTDFVSLHNQTEFSILDSLITPKGLFKKAKELGQTAVAITDHGSLAGAWDAWKASKDTGVKLIIGCECYFQDDASSRTCRRWSAIPLGSLRAHGSRCAVPPASARIFWACLPRAAPLTWNPSPLSSRLTRFLSCSTMSGSPGTTSRRSSRLTARVVRHHREADRRRLYKAGHRRLVGRDGALDPRRRRAPGHEGARRLRLRALHRGFRRALRRRAARLRGHSGLGRHDRAAGAAHQRP